MLLDTDGDIEGIGIRSMGNSQAIDALCWQEISKIATLKTLEIEDIEPTRPPVFPKYLTRLRLDSLRGDNSRDFVIRLLFGQRSLQFVDVRNVSGFTDEHLELLAQNRHLGSLKLAQLQFSGIGFKAFNKHDNSFDVEISNCTLSKEGLQYLLECDKLESLLLSVSEEECAVLSALANSSSSASIFVEINVGPDSNSSCEALIKKLQSRMPTNIKFAIIK